MTRSNGRPSSRALRNCSIASSPFAAVVTVWPSDAIIFAATSLTSPSSSMSRRFPSPAGGGARRRPPGARCPARRQIDGEDAPLAEAGAHLDEAVVAPDDRIRGRQPQAAALLLGGEIGVEDPRQVLAGNSRARVLHVDPDEFPPGRDQRVAACRNDLVSRGDLHRAPERHRLAGVEHEVLDHLGQLPLVGVHGPQVLVDDKPIVGTRAAQRELHRVFQDRRRRERPLERLAALREGQQLGRQVHGQREGLFGLLEHLLRLVALPEVHPRERDVPEQALQQVVEVVRDAAGQGPDRLELLGSDQLLLQPPALGDVAVGAPEADERAPRVRRRPPRWIRPTGRCRPCGATAARPPATPCRWTRWRRTPPWPGAHPRGGAAQRSARLQYLLRLDAENVANAVCSRRCASPRGRSPRSSRCWSRRRTGISPRTPATRRWRPAGESASRSESAIVLRAVASEKNSFLPTGVSRLPRSPDAIRSAKALLSSTERVTVRAIVRENSAVTTSTMPPRR